jgi:hypothetical protein
MLRSRIIGGSLAAALVVGVSSVALAAEPGAPGSPLPATASARSDDTAYCVQLSALYRRHLGSGTVLGQNLPDASATTAMDQCQRGNTAAGIQVLEKKLRDAQITLPKRG